MPTVRSKVGAVQLGIFVIIVACNSARHLVSELLRKTLEMRWRESLTHSALDIWMSNKAYWHLAQKQHGNIDNPDQRIAEDCKYFVSGVLSEILDLIERVVGLGTYLAVLWSLSDFALEFTLLGTQIVVPRYMVWAAFLYVALSTAMTHFLGKPLKSLISAQQKREADFRFALARWRENMDEVALSKGETRERATFDERFAGIAENWRILIRREFILGSFTYPYFATVLRVPLFIALPAYFAGNVAFGGLMKLSGAFMNVVTELSWFIFSYRALADIVAASSRLDNFLQAARKAPPPAPSFARAASTGTAYLDSMTLALPNGQNLMNIAPLLFKPGEAVWLHGPSGIGKTTLTKAMAGFWTWGEGSMSLPDDTMFLPQKPYMPLGSILEAAAYPKHLESIDTSRIAQALTEVGLGHCLQDTITDDLSGGELQRVALARVLVHRPSVVVLDEATSALDAVSEERLLQSLARHLPETAIVLIAHRKPKGLRKLRSVNLGDNPMPAAIAAE